MNYAIQILKTLSIFFVITNSLLAQSLEWQYSVYSLDSLPKNVKKLMPFVSKAVKIREGYVLPVGLSNTLGILEQKGRYTTSHMYLTRDSGKSFSFYSKSFLPDSTVVRSVTMFDSLRGYALCDDFTTADSIIDTYDYETHDGARTWTIITDTNRHRNVSFAFRDRVCLRYDSYPRDKKFAYSIDNGKHWQFFQHPEKLDGYSYSDIYLVDSTTFFVCQYRLFTQHGIGTKFFLTTDRGATWLKLGCTVKGYESDSCNVLDLRGFKFLNDKEGIAIGFWSLNPRYDREHSNLILRTSTGGRTWQVVDSLYDTDSLYRSNDVYTTLEQINGDTCVVLSDMGRVKISADRGKTWNWLVKDAPLAYYSNIWQKINNIKAVSFFDSHTAIATFGTLGRQDGKIDILRLVPAGTVSVTDDETLRQTIEGKIERSTVWIERIGPLPAQNEVTALINIPPDIERNSIRFSIYDIMGNRVLQSSLNELSLQPHWWGMNWFTVTLPCRELADGVYILSISGGDYERSKAFIHLRY